MIYDGLAILGFGGHARSVADVALELGIRSLRFIDENARPGEHFAGFVVVKDLEYPLPSGWAAFPALGDSVRRQHLVQFALRNNIPLATLIAKSAYIGREATVAKGVFIGNNVSVGPATRLGIGCIINTSAVVDHESVIGEYTHVSVNATVAGRCQIGNNVMIGAGAVIIDGIHIADGVIVGAGAVVVHDIDEAGVYVGVPAKCLNR
ncbi:NeuD/PglB/VioB family sugar acetyltransferase [Tepidiphilus succinatimandens]|uniref:NeuD/PglB/VioB family sugar acetyltransferase n=1 Tax=Tepidiphilus succinatimandens TaxID=224436 RepID=UPI00112EFB89|nr:NeuD/PglB/VioB family sugar acetyltransferase [Tepidiphilus succinatimandens]